MQKRLFLAIPLPPEVLVILDQYKKSLTLEMAKWTPTNNLHLTLCFLGNINEQLILPLIDAYHTIAARHGPFQLKFKAMTFAPSQDPRRMIWAEFYNSPAYQNLADDTQKTLRLFFANKGHEFKENSKSTIPHCTMARNTNSDFTPFPLPQPEIPDFVVDTVCLMSSQLSPEGSVYTTLHRFGLQSLQN